MWSNGSGKSRLNIIKVSTKSVGLFFAFQRRVQTREIVTWSFITAPRKRAPPHVMSCQDPTPTRFSATACRWKTRPISGKIYLRFLSQGADHEMSADWLAAGPRPGDVKTLNLASESSLCLLQLFSDSILLLPLLLRPTLLLVELVLLLSLLFFFARSLLEALLVYEFSFFIFRLLVVSTNSLFPGCL